MYIRTQFTCIHTYSIYMLDICTYVPGVVVDIGRLRKYIVHTYI